MNELGIDLSDRTPLLTRGLAEQADIIVTMGCGDQCPYIPGKRYIDWDLPDPAGQPCAILTRPDRALEETTCAFSPRAHHRALPR